MKTYHIKTLGCQMNEADSEKINMILMQSGFKKIETHIDADLIIFNTCSVRQKGEDRVFGYIEEYYKEAKKSDKNQIIGITGCMTRKTGLAKKYLKEDTERNRAKKIELLDSDVGIYNNDDKLFPRLEHLDFTLRIEDIKYLPKILSHISGEHIGQDDKYDDYLKQSQLRNNPASASIIIQTGCDNYCTYCIVPYTRGAEISRDKGNILAEIKEAVDKGAKEITLLGQNVNSYGKDTKKTYWDNEANTWKNSNIKTPFRELLDEIDQIDGLDRIRFTSSNPHDMTKDIIDSHFELNSTCNYLHFALQSGSDEILRKMNRRHNYTQFKNMVDYLRTKDPLFSISTDIIVGFSGETDEMFEETVRAIRECQFDFIYIARYSPRKGTIANKIYPDDIPDKTKGYRWHTLNNLLLENIQNRNNLMLGKIEKILISNKKGDYYSGRTRNFKEIFFKTDKKVNIGELVDIKITSLDKYVLNGELI